MFKMSESQKNFYDIMSELLDECERCGAGAFSPKCSSCGLQLVIEYMKLRQFLIDDKGGGCDE